MAIVLGGETQWVSPSVVSVFVMSRAKNRPNCLAETIVECLEEPFPEIPLVLRAARERPI